VPARLILVEALDLAWYRARCLGHQHVLLPADPVLVGIESLQGWLWQRLEDRSPSAGRGVTAAGDPRQE
jgi:hypothetical protein